LYSPLPASTACLVLPPGCATAANATAYAACPAGSFLNATSLACDACAPGTYAPQQGSVACIPVPAGSFASPGGAAYTTCPASTFLNASLRCQPCGAGSVSPAGAIS
jgi:hypothetical protein